MKSALALSALSLALLAPAAGAAPAGSPIPAFDATALSGKKVTQAGLLGQPTVLIVTPSKGAAGDTRKWAQALRDTIDTKSIRVRDVLAIDLPFFMSESDALGRAKEKIPKRYHDQTWLSGEQKLESALGIPPDSASAYVFVLDSQGKVVARVHGAPTRQRIDEIGAAIKKVK